MAKYKIKVNVELIECDESINSEPMKHDNGNFTMTISEQDAISIDKCESSILRTAYPTIRDAISKHLTEISKKKPKKEAVKKK